MGKDWFSLHEVSKIDSKNFNNNSSKLWYVLDREQSFSLNIKAFIWNKDYNSIYDYMSSEVEKIKEANLSDFEIYKLKLENEKLRQENVQ